ncbi:MAG: hypothetical protein JWN79_2941 [Gemmatimonadetes bacterium]|nr:hypothetical protein [Gemmatimonadota bacterium]
MRRQPIVLRAFFALFVVWLAVNASPRGTPTAPGSAVGSVHGDFLGLSSPHATIRGVAFLRKAPPPDAPSRAFLPSRDIAAPNDGAIAPSAFQLVGIRERASRTVTYDATAPPAIPNTVR